MKPFSNSTEYMAWVERNCLRCANYNNNITDIEETLQLLADGNYCFLQWETEKSMWSDFDEKALDRIGQNEHGGIAGICKERELILED